MTHTMATDGGGLPYHRQCAISVCNPFTRPRSLLGLLVFHLAKMLLVSIYPPLVPLRLCLDERCFPTRVLLKAGQMPLRFRTQNCQVLPWRRQALIYTEDYGQ